ncbi:ferredoxin family protein [Shinella sp. S4-D37]|uniref:4Fe-4S dicluster domain-containing protein n=1 Tax=Shinella sp. S4-D37 TaxID=3161999 RepID=UPI003467CF6B
MIEVVSADRCIRCDICERICPAFVFDRDETGLPVIARQDDCQTCFLCEIYCPTDALYVAEKADGPTGIAEPEVLERDLFGAYARALGWNRGRAGGTRNDPTRHIRVAQV